jgi:hypothetical protein
MKKNSSNISSLRTEYFRYALIVIVITAFACLFPALKLKYYYNEIEKITSSTYAIVCGIDYGYRGHRKDVCVYEVNGQRYYKTFGLEEFEIGKMINITYDPSNPEMATLPGHGDDYYNKSCVRIFLFIVAGAYAIKRISDKYYEKKRYFLKKSKSRKT